MEIDQISFSTQNNIEIIDRIIIIKIDNTIILGHQLPGSILRINNTDIVWITTRSTLFQESETIEIRK